MSGPPYALQRLPAILNFSGGRQRSCSTTSSNTTTAVHRRSGLGSPWREEPDLLAVDKQGKLYIFEIKVWEAQAENLLRPFGTVRSSEHMTTGSITCSENSTRAVEWLKPLCNLWCLVG